MFNEITLNFDSLKEEHLDTLFNITFCLKDKFEEYWEYSKNYFLINKTLLYPSVKLIKKEMILLILKPLSNLINVLHFNEIENSNYTIKIQNNTNATNNSSIIIIPTERGKLLQNKIFEFTKYLNEFGNGTYKISNSIINSSHLFINKVMPSLLPMFIISKLLINYNFPSYISKLFKNNIYIYILLISFITGSPNNIILIKDLLNNDIISINEANKYIKCNFFTNPLFLYNMLNSLFNNKIAISIILSQLLGNIIIYLFNKTKNTNIVKIKSKSFSNCLIESIKESTKVLLNIYITIILFNIIILIIPKCLTSFTGLIEITQGLNNLKNLNIKEFNKIILSIIYISFGGLSIHIQIKSVITDTQINYIFFNNIINYYYMQLFPLVINYHQIENWK